jgi:hypothetical protein
VGFRYGIRIGCSMCSVRSLCYKAVVSHSKEGSDADRSKECVDWCSDGLFHIPASSVAVEKHHVSVQQICSSTKGSAGKKAATIQQSTYCKAVATPSLPHLYLLVCCWESTDSPVLIQ